MWHSQDERLASHEAGPFFSKDKESIQASHRITSVRAALGGPIYLFRFQSAPPLHFRSVCSQPARHWKSQGVTIFLPTSTTATATATMGPGKWIDGAHVHIQIGSDCRFDFKPKWESLYSAGTLWKLLPSLVAFALKWEIYFRLATLIWCLLHEDVPSRPLLQRLTEAHVNSRARFFALLIQLIYW